MAREAVIVSTARTPIGKAYRGAFNNLEGATLGSIPIAEAVKRAKVAVDEVEDTAMGCVLTQGTTGGNIGRLSALRAGLPVSVPGITLDRKCSSGLMAIAMVAKQIVHEHMNVAIGGGIDSVSLVQNENMNLHRHQDASLIATHPDVYIPMLQTAEVVAKRYKISREAQDEYGARSQARAVAANEAGKLKDELVPVTTTKLVTDKETGQTSEQEITLKQDEGLRAGTTPEVLAGLKTVIDGGCITAGNASQLSDAASAVCSWKRVWLQNEGLSPWVFTEA